MNVSDHTYAVTFNDYINGNEDDYGVGEESMASTDFVGNNVKDLVEEVNTSDPSYPMKYVEKDDGNVLGLFYSADGDIEDGYDAILYKL